MSSRTVLVTGASRGIGFETARVLAAKGHQVIATARSKADLVTLQKRSDGDIRVFPADLTNENDLASLTNLIQEVIGDLDGLIHNAGLLINKPFRDLSDRDWQTMIDVNVMAPVRLTRRLIGYMKRDSHILHISSMGGYQQSRKFPGLTGYSVSKAGVATLAECLAEEFKANQISVNCLCLGAVQTEMLEEAFPGMEAPVKAEEMGRYVADFILEGHHLYNGKVLPVSLSDPG